ncbi:hypothetical protein [Streptomyces decoyicus]|uniref:hypothetical protein n=1 Tax=Streptomyces decoyicus TaxID=249567 RepID=UPI00382AB469
MQGLTGSGKSGKKNSGGVNPLAALALAGNNPLAALGAAGNPAAALGLLAGGGLPNPVAGLGQAAGALNPMAAAGQVSNVVSGAADMAGGPAQLPQQTAQLSELIATRTGVLESVQAWCRRCRRRGRRGRLTAASPPACRGTAGRGLPGLPND